MKEDHIEIMVLISNPPQFCNWNQERKVERYERVVKWHDYALELYQNGNITQLWGTHELLSRFEFTTSLGLLIAVYKVHSWFEFDELLNKDPLRDCSQYVTIPLESLFDDAKSDTVRFETLKDQLFKVRNSKYNKSGRIGSLVYSAYRSLFRAQPEYVGKYQNILPKNPVVNIEKIGKPGDSLEILIFGANPDEVVTLWNDTRKFIHYEKVQWWHDYTRMMLTEGKISHVWGTHDFCHIEGLSKGFAAAVTVFTVKSYSEFDEIYKLDPIRDSTQFWSVLLQPIRNQRTLDEERLEIARKNLM